MSENKLIDLEIKLSEAQRIAEDLSDVVAEQAKRIDVLEARVRMLMERAASDEQVAGSVVMGDSPPPHY
jgi:SlyX protein